jgi:hypothetical protein
VDAVLLSPHKWPPAGEEEPRQARSEGRMTQEAFLEAVAEAPEDYAPQLVYAG